MTATLHRLLLTIGSFFGGLGGLWALSDVQVLGIPPEVGAVCSIIAFTTNLLANAIRVNWPVETG